MGVHRRPVIGLPAATERARWGAWDQEAVLVPRAYTGRVQAAGGVAVVLSPDTALAEDPSPALDLLDGLLLIGGIDVDPTAYGQDAHPATDLPQPERDAFEVALLRGAMERDLPVLAVCRGVQVLNVAQGGDLRQHLPDELGHDDHRRVLGTFDGADHDVRLRPGSLAARAAGEERHATKSHHHQGLGRIGEGLEVTGWAVMDDLPEAVESPDHRFVLGVQWHPEADELSRVIAALVREAREFAADRQLAGRPRRAATPGP